MDESLDLHTETETETQTDTDTDTETETEIETDTETETETQKSTRRKTAEPLGVQRTGALLRSWLINKAPDAAFPVNIVATHCTCKPVISAHKCASTLSPPSLFFSLSLAGGFNAHDCSSRSQFLWEFYYLATSPRCKAVELSSSRRVSRQRSPACDCGRATDSTGLDADRS